jgi:hypothetical protein
MQIHTVGDSHSYAGWDQLNEIQCNHIGPVLAFSFGRDKLERCNIKQLGVNENDIVIFCFGEIDCRAHVHKHISPDKNYKTIIKEIVAAYMDGVAANAAQYTNLHICIYNVVPPPEYYIDENVDFPMRGTSSERKQYVQYFNRILANECKKRNYIFLNTYKYYSTKNGFLNMDLSDGAVHIKNCKPLKRILFRLIQHILNLNHAKHSTIENDVGSP